MAVWSLLLQVTLCNVRSAWMISVCVDVFSVRLCYAFNVVSQIMLLMGIFTPSIHFLSLLCSWSFSSGSPQL